MAVFSQTTGVLDGILLDNGWLTDLRTAAAGALFARHLGPKVVTAIGMVGTGVQARFQLLLLKEVTDCRCVVLWGRREAGRDACAADLRKLGYEVTVTSSIAAVTAQCNLIVTVTSSTEALITEEHTLLPGTHINAFGSDGVGKQELHPSVLARADVVVADSLKQCCEFGETSHALAAGVAGMQEKLCEAGTFLSTPSLFRKEGGVEDARITVADSTGVAVQDVAISRLALDAHNTVTSRL